MARPPKCRTISCAVPALYFKPRGVPLRELQEVVLELDEVEALRLADAEGLYQEEAALRMGISRQTFGNIIGRARHKVASAILGGLALKINQSTAETDAGDASDACCRQCGRT